MLLEMSLENFKAFGNKQVARLAPITLIYGPNSAGKSSLIQSLLLMKQTVSLAGSRTSHLIMRGDIVDLGTFKSVLHKHDSRRLFKMSLSYSPLWFGETPALPSYPLHFNAKITSNRTITTTFQAKVSRGTNKRDSSQLTDICFETIGHTPIKLDLEQSRSLSNSAKYETAGSEQRAFQFTRLSKDDVSEFFKKMLSEKRTGLQSAKLQQLLNHIYEQNSSGELAPIFNGVGYFVANNLLPVFSMTKRDKASENQDDMRRLFQLLAGFVEALSYEYMHMLRNISYLGPVRIYPPRLYFMTGGKKTSVGIQGEDVPAVIYQDQRKLTKLVNEWFQSFEIPYKIKIDDMGNDITGKLVSLALEDRASKVSVAPSDVGFGIGQLLPIIVEGLISSNRVLLVEQPEIHLHPKLQAHIADFVIETSGLKKTAEDGSTRIMPKNQWIIETHSEALILRLQKRIRQGTISKEDVSILYVSQRPADGSKIIQLRLDDHGDFIDEWPHGFFEESFDELFGG